MPLGIVLLLGLTQACGGTGGTASEQTPLVTATGDIPSTALLGDCSGERIASSGGYSLDPMSAAISGKVLTISVSPMGGCDGDTFYACWPAIFRTSDPPVAFVNLVRKGSQVSCTTTPKSKVLSIDLDGIEELYKTLWPSELNGRVSVGLNNPTTPGGGVTLTFEF